MEKLDVHPRIIRALRKGRITQPRTVLETSLPDLCRLTKLSLQDVCCLVKAVSQTIPRPPVVSALNLHKKKCHELQNIHKVTTGCPILDRRLKGGILSQGITEISGESSSGKTQICLQLCLTVQLPYSFGGLNGAAVFISTEDVFPSKRLQQIIPEFEEKYKKVFKAGTVGDSIFIEHAADVETLMILIKKRLPTLLEKMNVKLIIVDSMAALLRVEYSVHEMAKRSKVMNTIAARLRELSYKNNVPVVCVNQVSAVFNESSNQDIIPSLGLTWSNLITVRLMLSRTKTYNNDEEHACQLDNPTRLLKVIFAPHLPNLTCSFIVDSNGVHGIVD